jgi:hypothetical protein
MTQTKLFLFFVFWRQASNFKIPLISYPFFNMLFWSYSFQIYDAHSNFLQTEFTNSEATQARSHSATNYKESHV